MIDSENLAEYFKKHAPILVSENTSKVARITKSEQLILDKLILDKVRTNRKLIICFSGMNLQGLKRFLRILRHACFVSGKVISKVDISERFKMQGKLIDNWNRSKAVVHFRKNISSL